MKLKQIHKLAGRLNTPAPKRIAMKIKYNRKRDKYNYKKEENK
jgi:hypothetical protein